MQIFNCMKVTGLTSMFTSGVLRMACIQQRECLKQWAHKVDDCEQDRQGRVVYEVACF